MRDERERLAAGWTKSEEGEWVPPGYARIPGWTPPAGPAEGSTPLNPCDSRAIRAIRDFCAIRGRQAGSGSTDGKDSEADDVHHPEQEDRDECADQKRGGAAEAVGEEEEHGKAPGRSGGNARARPMSRPGFTGCTIDRADHLRLDPAKVAALAAAAGARLLRLAGLDPVLGGDGTLRWDPVADADSELIFLGLDGEAALFAPLARIAAPPPGAFAMFRILDSMAPADAALWGTARSLIGWHNRHLFCGACGSATASFRAGWARRCEGCGAEHFPRVDPVVIMLAEHEGRVLVGRQPFYPPRRYSALAGFVEPGESIEEAVARELAEEAGLAVSNVRYAASQPWPFPGSLMIACLATAESSALTLDREELEDAIWVDRSGVAAALAGEEGAPFLAPPHFAIARTLLEHWLASP